MSDEEQLLESRIEEFILCLSSDPLRIQEIDHSKEEDMNSMAEEDIQNDPVRSL